jgi:hypothetical protein
MGPLKTQNGVNITFPAEGRLLTFFVLGNTPLHALNFAYKLIVVYQCVIACDNPLQESISLFKLLL